MKSSIWIIQKVFENLETGNKYVSFISFVQILKRFKKKLNLSWLLNQVKNVLTAIYRKTYWDGIPLY